jgi:hypothetical protein
MSPCIADRKFAEGIPTPTKSPQPRNSAVIANLPTLPSIIMANAIQVFLAAVSAVVFYALFQEFLSPSARRRRRLPPGPPGVPFFGNTDFPTFNAHIKFKEWADQYGEIFSLRLGPTNIVVLNSDRVIKDLMDSVFLLKTVR